jgi:hypothetical protein
MSHASPSAAVPAPNVTRSTYVVLAVLVGCLGIHNYAAGYRGRANAQLLMGTVGWVTLGLLPLAAMIWAWIEAATVTHDGNGVPMNGNAGQPVPTATETPRRRAA